MFGSPFFSLNSLEITEEPSLGENRQFRFPKSKKKRIRRKWAKNPKYWKFIPDKNVYRVGRRLIAHPETVQQMKAALERENSCRNDRTGSHRGR